MTVPLVDLKAQHDEVADEVMAGFQDVMETAAFVQGEAVTAFEDEYARFSGTRHCIGVANGTDALEIALRAAGVGPGDEVILPANTFIATAEAVLRAGADPVLVDVDDAYLLVDPDAVQAAMTARTRAIIPVHLYGQIAPVERLLPLAAAAGAVVIEDAAQAQGAIRHGQGAGTFGIAAGTSFYPGKNLGAYGDAGAVLTNDDDVASRARRIANHGSAVRYQHDVAGMNSRLDTLQAVVLRAKLARLEKWNESRRDAALRYDELLAPADGVRRPRVMPGNEHVWHLYVVRVDRRDEVLSRLQQAGIGAAIHYPVPLHLTPALRHLGLARGALPVAEAAAARALSLPMHPHLSGEQQEAVVRALLSCQQ